MSRKCTVLLVKFVAYVYHSNKLFLAVGFFIGALFALLMVNNEGEEINLYSNSPSETPYSQWLRSKGLVRKYVDADVASYGKLNRSLQFEAEYLYQNIHVVCVIFVRRVKNAVAVNNTWGKHCNELMFFGLFGSNEIPLIQLQSVSSWHFLCDSIRFLWKKHKRKVQWALFVPDDVFALPENLRYYVAPFDHNLAYYMGHAMRFWGVSYNLGQAGYVLSRGTIEKLFVKFNTTESCAKSGKHWRNEDYYLGKHLGTLGVEPMDTRDETGEGKFHGYGFNQLLFPGKVSTLGSYWKKSIYPIEQGMLCCSNNSITFHGIEADKIYLFYYLLYHIKVFRTGGQRGNLPASTPVPEEDIWKKFLVDEGFYKNSKEAGLISADEFYEIWKNKISPTVFNQNLKNAFSNRFNNSNVYANMPDVLESLLNSVHVNSSINEV